MAKILTIITVPSQKLRQRSVDLEQGKPQNRKFRNLCQDMIITMLEKDGVGLAAPQIGHPLRLIVVNTKNGPTIMINPKITKKSWRKEWGEEGCLSVPHTFGLVKRHKTIACVYRSEKGEKAIVKAAGLLARVIQHEIDHLDGVLFIDKT